MQRRRDHRTLFTALIAVGLLVWPGCGSRPKESSEPPASDRSVAATSLSERTATASPPRAAAPDAGTEPEAAGPAGQSRKEAPPRKAAKAKDTLGKSPSAKQSARLKDPLPGRVPTRSVPLSVPRAIAASPDLGPGTPRPEARYSGRSPLVSPPTPGVEPDRPETEATPWQPGTSASSDDYTLVTVFYGTDRNFLERSEARKQAYLGWYYATAWSAGITIVLAIVALRRSPGRTWRILGGGGLAATVALGIVTTLARLHSEEIDPGDHPSYGNERGELQTGTCQVSVPRYHESGEIERPSVLKFQFREDPRKHVVLMDVIPEPAEEFFSQLKARVDAAPRREALVFVHGFNVTFEDAARRTAQLAYDLKFEGPPIFFSWPSQGGLLQYAVDETNVAWAVPHVKDFLAAVARRSGAESVHLIAHSMGNRALTSALADLAAKMRKRTPMFQEVILTAPDIDADIFKRDIAPAITKTAGRVTLYASSNDEALILSKKLHGYPRAGDSGSALVVVPGIETIDVSDVDTSLLGHSYYGNNDTVLADMFYLLHESRPASQRQWLEGRRWGNLQYWALLSGAELQREATRSEPPLR